MNSPDNTELRKYESIYNDSSGRYAQYGRANHGRNALPLLGLWQCQSLLDVGCGHNKFICDFRLDNPNADAIGVDFACPNADVRACASELPFSTRRFDVVTAFDMLEHILPEQVDKVLKELARVAGRFIFSICYRPSRITWQNQNLHPTVQPESWWINRIDAAGGCEISKYKNYITGNWK